MLVAGQREAVGGPRTGQDADLASLAQVVSTVEDVADTRVRVGADPVPDTGSAAERRIIAVWGPTGAPSSR